MPDQHHPAASSPLVGVSYVMPVLNDASHVHAAVESILAQDYAGPVEVLIALGPSIEGTALSRLPRAATSLGRRAGYV